MPERDKEVEDMKELYVESKLSIIDSGEFENTTSTSELAAFKF